jgi:hypothetical protein
MWYGHLVSLVEDRYLVDTTFDQVNEDEYFKLKNAKPLVLDLRQTEWFATDATRRCPNWTGDLQIFPGSRVDYGKFHRQTGWKSAGDFRPRQRKEVVELLVKKAAPILKRGGYASGPALTAGLPLFEAIGQVASCGAG